MIITIASVGAVVLLVAAIGIFALLNNDDDTTQALPTTTTSLDVTDTPTDEPTTDDPNPGPTGETFNMPLGDGVEVTQPDGDQWTVYIVEATWFDEPCREFGVADHPIVVLDVEFEVLAGTASVNPLFDFEYVTNSGATADSSLFSFCDDPALTDSYDRSAGDLVTGQIAFEVPGGEAGRVEYSSTFDLTASWVIPGRN